MEAKFKGNKGAKMYRGVAFVGTTPTPVTPEWFEYCTNPNIVEVKPKKKKKAD